MAVKKKLWDVFSHAPSGYIIDGWDIWNVLKGIFDKKCWADGMTELLIHQVNRGVSVFFSLFTEFAKYFTLCQYFVWLFLYVSYYYNVVSIVMYLNTISFLKKRNVYVIEFARLLIFFSTKYTWDLGTITMSKKFCHFCYSKMSSKVFHVKSA